MKEPVVMIVDDEPDVRAALGLLLKSVNYQVKVFESAQDYWTKFDPEQPGCLILDVRMPGMSGLELQTQLGQLDYHPPIIMISGHGELAMAVNAVKAGAMDFLQKPVSDQTLLDRVSQALKKDAEQRQTWEQLKSVQARYESLTAREREVLAGVVHGKLNKIIASDLHVSTRTVEIHRAHMMEKMEAGSLTALMRCVSVLEDHGVINRL